MMWRPDALESPRVWPTETHLAALQQVPSKQWGSTKVLRSHTGWPQVFIQSSESRLGRNLEGWLQKNVCKWMSERPGWHI